MAQVTAVIRTQAVWRGYQCRQWLAHSICGQSVWNADTPKIRGAVVAAAAGASLPAAAASVDAAASGDGDAEEPPASQPSRRLFEHVHARGEFHLDAASGTSKYNYNAAAAAGAAAAAAYCPQCVPIVKT